MSIIATTPASLAQHPDRFQVEAIAEVLPQKVIDGALADSGVANGRRHKLPVRLTVWVVILLCLFRDRSYVNLIRMLATASSWRGLWKRSSPPTSSALSRARDRVGVSVMQLIYERSARRWIEESEGRIFHGLRLSAIDGTCVKIPDSTKNNAWFGRPGASRGQAGYPQLRLVGLMDIGTRLQRAARFGPYRTQEITLVRDLLGEIPAGLLILMDRHFVAYDFLWDILQRGSQFIVRAKRNLNMRVIRELGPGDALVEINVPRHWRRDRSDMPRKIILREVRYTPCGAKEEIRLFTSLLDADEVAAEEIADCYHERWSEETELEEIKTRLGMATTITRPIIIRSKTPTRVEQEMWALLIASNILRITMVQAVARTPDSPPPTRLSFTAALHQFRDGIRDMMQLPTARLFERHIQLLEDIASIVVPLRPGRTFPRAVKIKMSGYPLKRTAKPAA